MKKIKDIIRVNYMSAGLLIIFAVNYLYLVPLTDSFLKENNVEISTNVVFFTTLFVLFFIAWLILSNVIYILGSQEIEEQFFKVHLCVPLLAAAIALRTLFLPLMDVRFLRVHSDNTGSLTIHLAIVLCVTCFAVIVPFGLLYGSKSSQKSAPLPAAETK